MLLAMFDVRKYTGHTNGKSMPLRARLSIPQGLMLLVLMDPLLFSQVTWKGLNLTEPKVKL